MISVWWICRARQTYLCMAAQKSPEKGEKEIDVLRLTFKSPFGSFAFFFLHPSGNRFSWSWRRSLILRQSWHFFESPFSSCISMARSPLREGLPHTLPSTAQPFGELLLRKSGFRPSRVWRPLSFNGLCHPKSERQFFEWIILRKKSIKSRRFLASLFGSPTHSLIHVWKCRR